jgi:outer membrane protein assembly factor BamD (BamD/ComL family)
MFVMVVACTSSSNQDAEASKLVTEANKNVDKYNALQKEIDDAWAKVNSFPATTEGYQEKAKVTQEIESKVKQQHDEIKSAVDEFNKAYIMKISSDYKVYIKMLVDSTNKRLESNDYVLKMTQKTTEVAQGVAAGTATTESIDAAGKEIDDMSAKAQALESEGDKIKAKADQYFIDKKLGE